MKKAIVSILAFGPMLALAQTSPNFSYIESLMNEAKRLVGLALPLVVAIALLVFFWGIVQFIAGGEAKRDEGKKHMIWGIVGLFVMVAVWGLVGFLGTLVLGNNTAGGSVQVPTVQGIQ